MMREIAATALGALPRRDDACRTIRNSAPLAGLSSPSQGRSIDCMSAISAVWSLMMVAAKRSA